MHSPNVRASRRVPQRACSTKPSESATLQAAKKCTLECFCHVPEVMMSLHGSRTVASVEAAVCESKVLEDIAGSGSHADLPCISEVAVELKVVEDAVGGSHAAPMGSPLLQEHDGQYWTFAVVLSNTADGPSAAAALCEQQREVLQVRCGAARAFAFVRAPSQAVAPLASAAAAGFVPHGA